MGIVKNYIHLETPKRNQLSLKKYERKIFSQYGQDGVLENLLSRIKPLNEIKALEVGGWDGVYLSNICNLAKNFDAYCIFIESNKEKFDQILINHKAGINKKKVFAFNSFLTATGSTSAAGFLKKAGFNDLDFISIDVDGMDYFIFRDLGISPKVVLIEYNQTFHPNVEFIQSEDPSVNIGASSTAIGKLAIKKGYSIVHYFTTDLLLVRNDLIESMNLDVINYQEITSDSHSYIGFGYNGEMFSVGNGKFNGPSCPWEYGIKISPTRFQPLPSFLRFFYDSSKPSPFLIFKFLMRGIYLNKFRKLPIYISNFLNKKIKK